MSVLVLGLAPEMANDPPEQPFPQALRALLEKHELSFRALAAKTAEYRPDGLSSGYLHRLAQGKDRPSIEAFEVIAAAIGVGPETFGEYRLAVARRQLDERDVGLGQALQNLAYIETAMQTLPSRRQPRASAPDEASRRPGRAGSRATRSPRAG